MTGKVAGVSVTPTSGAPRSGISTSLLETGSISDSNRPHYIADGVILAVDAVGIDTQDIKNIEIFKGWFCRFVIWFASSEWYH